MEDKFHNLSKLIARSYDDGNTHEVKVLIQEYLNLAAQNKEDWNYGNAIHQAYTFLGLIALEENDVKKAKEYLLESGRTPGSPQLKSFGPNMLLAKKLLEKGEKDAVLTYIEMCKKFWMAIFRMVPIRKWKKAIKKGEVPDFGPNLIYHITPPS